MVNHEILLKPGDTLTVTAYDSNDRSTTAPRNNNNNANSRAGNFDGGAKNRKTTRKAKKESQAGGKRALSGYMKFCKAERPAILKETPGIEFKDVGKRLGAKWRSLSAAEQAKY